MVAQFRDLTIVEAPLYASDEESQGLLEYAPYCTAAFETRGLRFSPSRLWPDWRQDGQTPFVDSFFV